MDDIVPTTFSNAFLGWEILYFDSNCTEGYSYGLNWWNSVVQLKDWCWAFDKSLHELWTNGEQACLCLFGWPGPRLNIKTVLSTYGDFHDKDKTAVRTSYL